MKKKLIVLVFTLLGFNIGSYAQIFGDLGSNRVATTSFPFLKIGIGAREVGMAETGISTVNDANALFLNPSHITGIPNYSVSISQNQWFADISQTAFAGIFRFDNEWTYGLSLNYLTTAPMERRTTLQPRGTGEKFGFYDLAMGLTIARQMTAQFSFGVTGKFINERLAELNYNAYAIDLGMSYLMDNAFDGRLSITLMNFSGRFKPSGKATPPDTEAKTTFQDYNTPSTFQLGYQITPLKSDDQSFMLAFQLNHPNDNSENYSIGAEYEWAKMIYLRTGYKFNVIAQSVPSFGVGIRKPLILFDFQFDYGASYIDPLGMSHRFTLSLYPITNGF